MNGDDEVPLFPRNLNWKKEERDRVEKRNRGMNRNCLSNRRRGIRPKRPEIGRHHRLILNLPLIEEENEKLIRVRVLYFYSMEKKNSLIFARISFPLATFLF